MCSSCFNGVLEYLSSTFSNTFVVCRTWATAAFFKVAGVAPRLKTLIGIWVNCCICTTLQVSRTSYLLIKPFVGLHMVVVGRVCHPGNVHTLMAWLKLTHL